MNSSMKTVEEILKKHTGTLMSIKGVVGTGQGLNEGGSCIKVFVQKLTPELTDKIPVSIENIPVIIEETGRFTAT